MSDPLFAEIEAKILDMRIEPGEGAENAIDMIASIAGGVNGDEAEGDDGWRDALRAALLECAAFAVAGLRDAGAIS